MSRNKENETKREKFVRLAESRMDTLLKQIELMGNLSNTSNYDFKKEDLNKIIKTIKSSVAELEHKYNNIDKTNKFKL